MLGRMYGYFGTNLTSFCVRIQRMKSKVFRSLGAATKMARLKAEARHSWMREVIMSL